MHPAAPSACDPSGDPSPKALALAFLAAFLIWGSTDLAILRAIDPIPPFTMAGIRFVIAGSLLGAWGLLTGARRPSGTSWFGVVRGLLGVGLLVGGEGGRRSRVPASSGPR